MKPIRPESRRVANIHTAAFKPFIASDGTIDGEVLQINDVKCGFGFHVYRMHVGQHTIPHTHIGAEEFLLLEGDLSDHDGYEYQPGDLVWLGPGSEHSSHSQAGCLLMVFLPDAKGF